MPLQPTRSHLSRAIAILLLVLLACAPGRTEPAPSLARATALPAPSLAINPDLGRGGRFWGSESPDTILELTAWALRARDLGDPSAARVELARRLADDPVPVDPAPVLLPARRVFGGYLLAAGDGFGRFLPVGSPGISEIAAAPASRLFRPLIVVCPRTRVERRDEELLVARLSLRDEASVSRAVAEFPRLAWAWSAGRLRIEPRIAPCPGPLGSLSRVLDAPAPGATELLRISADLSPELLEDGLILIWARPPPGPGDRMSAGFALHDPKALGFDFAAVGVSPGSGLGGEYPGEILVHEWLHLLSSRLAAEGRPVPRELDAAQGLPDARRSWQAWYRRFIGLALSPAAR